VRCDRRRARRCSVSGTVPAMHDDLRTAIDESFPTVRAALERLVRIPSVSAEGAGSPTVRQSAETVVELLAGAGAGDARLLEVPDAPPAAFAQLAAPTGAP